IEADNLEAATPRVAAPLDMILRVDDEAGALLVRGVTRPHGLGHFGIAAKQQPATLGRRRLPGMRHDRIERTAINAHSIFQIHDSKFWMTIAIPMPPPMQSEA